jgi:hypothetical protein
VEEVVMNRIRRFAAVMAGLAGTLLVFAADTPDAWATERRPTRAQLGTSLRRSLTPSWLAACPAGRSR